MAQASPHAPVKFSFQKVKCHKSDQARARGTFKATQTQPSFLYTWIRGFKLALPRLFLSETRGTPERALGVQVLQQKHNFLLHFPQINDVSEEDVELRSLQRQNFNKDFPSQSFQILRIF